MSFIILGDSFTFPDGDAATNRVYSYAKGFNENGIKVHVICFKSGYSQFSNGISEGINYYHPFGQSERNNFFLVRRWFNFRKYLMTYSILKKINKKDKIIAVTFYTQQLWTLLFAYFLAKVLKIKIILERSEYPLRDYRAKAIMHWHGDLKLALETKVFDGIFCISNFIIGFYREKGFSQNKLFLVPSTVDTERFSSSFNAPLPYQYIMYCGSLTILKDGVNILIESFAKIANNYPGINLVIVGRADCNEDDIIFKNISCLVLL